MPLNNPNDPGYGVYSTEQGLVSTAFPQSYRRARYIGRSRPLYDGRELSAEEEARRRRTSEEAQLTRKTEALAKKEKEIEEEYGQYVSDGEFAVYSRSGAYDPRRTEQKWQEYQAEYKEYETQLESTRSYWGTLASKYNYQSGDPVEMEKVRIRYDAREALLTGRYAVEPQNRFEKTIHNIIDPMKSHTIGSKWFAREHREAVASGNVLRQWQVGLTGVGSSFYYGVGKTILTAEKLRQYGFQGGRWVYEHPKEAWAGASTLASLGITGAKWVAKHPGLATSKAYHGTTKFVSSELGLFIKDPVMYGAELATFGKIIKAPGQLYRRGIAPHINKRFYTKIKYTLESDPYAKVRPSSQAGKFSATFDQRIIKEVIKVKDYSINLRSSVKKRWDLKDPMGTFISLEKKGAGIRKPLTLGKKYEELISRQIVTQRTTGRYTGGARDIVGNIKTRFTKKDFGGRRFQRQSWEVQLEKTSSGAEGFARRKYIEKQFPGTKAGGMKKIKTKGKDIKVPIDETGYIFTPIGKGIKKAIPKTKPLKGKLYEVETIITPMKKKGSLTLENIKKTKTSKDLVAVDKRLKGRDKIKDLVEDTPDLKIIQEGKKGGLTQIYSSAVKSEMGAITKQLAPKIKPPKEVKISTLEIKPSKVRGTAPLRQTPSTPYEQYGLLEGGGLAPRSSSAGLKNVLGSQFIISSKLKTDTKGKIQQIQKDRKKLRQDIGIGTMFKGIEKSKITPTQRIKSRQRFKIGQSPKIKTMQMQTFPFPGFPKGGYGWEGKMPLPPKTPKRKKPKDFDFSLGTFKTKKTEYKPGKRKHKRTPRYTPSLTGLALNIKQPKKTGKFTGLEIRGI